VGVHKGTPAIMDYKQSNRPKRREYIDDYLLQLCAYACAHNSVHGTDIRKGVVLMCVKPEFLPEGGFSEPVYQEFILEGTEFTHYEDLWWKRVETFYEGLV
jgi:hypothetical protein